MFPQRLFTEAVLNFKSNLPSSLELDSLQGFFDSAGLVWRERILTPSRTLHLFILQILHGNTSCTHVRHFSTLKFTAAAFCAARKRIPLGVLEKLVQSLTDSLFPKGAGEQRWRGHRVLLEDGSGCSMPDTDELRNHFGQPGGQRVGCGFPVAKLLMLFDAGTGCLQNMLVSRLNSHEISRAVEFLTQLVKGDIVVGDRGLCSFAHIALLFQEGIHVVFRVGANQQVDFRRSMNRRSGYHKVIRGQRIKKLGDKDQLVLWNKTSLIPKWLSKAEFTRLTETIVVRELRYHLNKRGFRSDTITIVTTLLDPAKYPKKAIADLYGLRWEVETNIRYLKTSLGMDQLKCKTIDGVRRELLVFSLVYNLVRAKMLEAAQRAGVSPNRVSFVDTLRWIRDGQGDGQFLNAILNPRRPRRRHPRVVKRRPKAFPRMTIPRNSFPGFSSTEQTVMA